MLEALEIIVSDVSLPEEQLFSILCVSTLPWSLLRWKNMHTEASLTAAFIPYWASPIFEGRSTLRVAAGSSLGGPRPRPLHGAIDWPAELYEVD